MFVNENNNEEDLNNESYINNFSENKSESLKILKERYINAKKYFEMN